MAWSPRPRRTPSTWPARSGPGNVTAQGVGRDPLASTGPGNGQGPGWGNQFTGIGQAGAFGGYKQSGLGREWGHHGLEEFTEVKQLSWS